jgi:hypothetical protein
MIGECRLNELRKSLLPLLSPAAMSVELRKGDLFVSDARGVVVAVLRRVDDEGGWCLEGTRSVVYETVRDLFYRHHVII